VDNSAPRGRACDPSARSPTIELRTELIALSGSHRLPIAAAGRDRHSARRDRDRVNEIGSTSCVRFCPRAAWPRTWSATSASSGHDGGRTIRVAASMS